MPLLDLNGPSATLAELAAKYGSRFHFTCQPCRYTVSFSGSEIVARYPGTVLFKHFQRHVVCGKCRMPVDGDFRTMEFSCTTDPAEAARMGHTPHGWSGPRDPAFHSHED